MREVMSNRSHHLKPSPLPLGHFIHIKSIINTIINTYVTMCHDHQGDVWCMTDTAAYTMHSQTYSSHCLFTTFLTYICLMGAILHCMYENKMNITYCTKCGLKCLRWHHADKPEIHRSHPSKSHKRVEFITLKGRNRIAGKILKKICF